MLAGADDPEERGLSGSEPDRDNTHECGGVLHRQAVDGNDDVAPGDDALALELDLARAAVEARARRRTAGSDALDERARGGREASAGVRVQA